MIDRSPEIVEVPAFSIVGVERYTDEGLCVMQEAWDTLFARIREIPELRRPPIAVGFQDYSRDFVMTPGEFPKFYFTAAMEVTSIGDVPDGMVGREVSACTCARFVHRGPTSGIAESYKYIYETWLPASEYILDPALACDFERHPKKSEPGVPTEVELYFPVRMR